MFKVFNTNFTIYSTYKKLFQYHLNISEESEVNQFEVYNKNLLLVYLN